MEKLVALVLVFAVIIVYLKSINNEIALLATIAAGVIIISLALEYVTNVFAAVTDLIALTGIDGWVYKIILKISAIGYLIEFGADVVNDFGLKSLADKLVFIGKIVIFTVSLPIIYAIINLLKGLTL